MGHVGMPELFVIAGVVFFFGGILTAVPYWFIFRKAGFHPAFCLLMIIPLVSLIMRFFLAFAEWPSLKRIDR
jgi:hypothetical protein